MRQPCIYAFDLDGTLLKGNSSINFYKHALKKGVFPYSTLPLCIFAYLKFCFSFSSLAKFYGTIASSLLASVSFQRLSSVAEEFADTLRETDFYLPTLNKFKEALADPSGKVMIFSSSPNFIVEPIAKRLGANACYASEFHNIFDRREFENQCLTGDNKAKILNHLKEIGKARSHTFSDHIVDLPFLLLGEEKTVVRPRGRLKKMARKYYWNIL